MVCQRPARHRQLCQLRGQHRKNSGDRQGLSGVFLPRRRARRADDDDAHGRGGARPDRHAQSPRLFQSENPPLLYRVQRAGKPWRQRDRRRARFLHAAGRHLQRLRHDVHASGGDYRLLLGLCGADRPDFRGLHHGGDAVCLPGAALGKAGGAFAAARAQVGQADPAGTGRLCLAPHGLYQKGHGAQHFRYKSGCL